VGWRRARAGGRAARGGDVEIESEEERKTTGLLFNGFTECQIAGTRQRFLKNIKIHFAECRQTGTRQTLTYLFLPSAARLALGKVCFAECLPWTLGKVCFLFFSFPNQTFCGMFLHYVDLHVLSWNNYNSVFNS
jgi:hypothetical protein